jgi:hypothetical protein
MSLLVSYTPIINKTNISRLFNFQTVKAMAIGKKGRVHVEDIVFLIRKDPKKYARVKVGL